MRAQLLDRRLRTRNEGDDGVLPLAPVGVGNADDGDLGDRRMDATALSTSVE